MKVDIKDILKQRKIEKLHTDAGWYQRHIERKEN